MVLSGVSYASGIGAQGQEKEPRVIRDETALNDAAATARVALERAAQQLREQNNIYKSLLAEAESLIVQAKALDQVDAAEDALQIAQKRKDLMKQFEQLVGRIHEQGERVDVLAAARAAARGRVDQLEGARDPNK